MVHQGPAKCHLRGQGHIMLRFPVKREIGEHFQLHPFLAGAVNCGKLVFSWLVVFGRGRGGEEEAGEGEWC